MHDHDATLLLNRFGRGESDVEAELLELVYGELRGLAIAHMRDQPAGHTLQPTALIHEAWMRLVRQDELEFDARAQFYRLASRTMRSILIDHARRTRAEKRGGVAGKVALESGMHPTTQEDASETHGLIELDQALGKLEELDPTLARLVEMRFFGGLSHPEIATALGSSLRTVERNWRLARAFLHKELA